MNPPSRTLFVTYRLVGSIPQSVLRQYKTRAESLLEKYEKLRRSHSPEMQKHLEEFERFKREWFIKFEDMLDRARTGPMWMKEDKVAMLVAQELNDLDGQAYTLDAYCIMSNHVHVVFKPLLTEASLQEAFDETHHLQFVSEYPSLSQIMHRLKGRSARQCNRALSRSGQFWEHESFDHVVRPGKLMSTVRYVLNNPVKAGLVEHWNEWRWSYCRTELYDKL